MLSTRPHLLIRVDLDPPVAPAVAAKVTQDIVNRAVGSYIDACAPDGTLMAYATEDEGIETLLAAVEEVCVRGMSDNVTTLPPLIVVDGTVLHRMASHTSLVEDGIDAIRFIAENGPSVGVHLTLGVHFMPADVGAVAYRMLPDEALSTTWRITIRNMKAVTTAVADAARRVAEGHAVVDEPWEVAA